MRRVRRTIRRHAFVLVLAGLFLLSAGCIRVVRQEAPYYAKGPKQTDPPDGFFQPGKRVMVFGERDSYCPVMTFDLIAGWVWKRDLVSVFEWDKSQEAAERSEKSDFGTDSE